MKCWVVDRKMPPHGNINLSDALKYSCNAFFYLWGNAAGIEQIDEVGGALGLGKKTGVPLSGESPGVLPGPEWLARVSPMERWSQGYTANVSIGQGSCECSPLQMAMVTASIANRGRSYKPKLVSRVLDQNGADVKDENGKLVAPHEPILLADMHQSGVTDEQIEMIRRGMWKVVNDGGGTGRKAQVKGIEVAGKTGTAQFWREVNGRKEKDNHTWFICFAPYDQPKFAICVMVEGGKSGGGTSAPIAQKILDESLALERGYDPGLVALEPVDGHFRPIEDVTFKGETLPNLEPAVDEEASDHNENAPPEPPTTGGLRRQVQAQPDIRAEADARGRVSPRNQPRRDPGERRSFFERLLGGGRRDREQPQRPPPGRGGR